MNIQEATERADCIAHVEIGSIVYKRFVEHINRNQPIKYYDRNDPSKAGHYNILHAINGLPGEVNFYLESVTKEVK